MNLLQINIPGAGNFDFLQSLWNLSPILVILVVLIALLIYKNEKLNNILYDPEKGVIALKDKQISELAKSKEAQLKELNDYIRENDKENLEVLSALNNTMDKLILTITSENDILKEKVVSEATGVKSHVDLKITELKTKL